MRKINQEESVDQSAPIFNVPAVVLIIMGILGASHFAIGILPGKLQALVQVYGGVSPRLFLAGPSAYDGFFAWIMPLVTHLLVHANVMHLALNLVWFLAFGAPVARLLNAGRSRLVGGILFTTLFVLSGVAGALAYIAVHPTANTLLVGASGGISGLLGALVRFAFGGSRQRRNGRYGSVLDRSILVWSAGIVALNVGLGLFGDAFVGGNDIAWEAHIGGYLFGLLTVPFFDAVQRRRLT